LVFIHLRQIDPLDAGERFVGLIVALSKIGGPTSPGLSALLRRRLLAQLGQHLAQQHGRRKGDALLCLEG